MIATLLTTHYTLFMVIIGTAILGTTCGLLGTFSVLRGNSLFGDAISHAALPGVACAFLLSASKNPAFLMLGGATSSIIATTIVLIARRYTRLKLDTLLGVSLAVFFGLGLVLMTIVQKLPLPHQSVLNKFIFGSAATLMPHDLYLMSTVSFMVILCVMLLWKELTISTFDASFAQATGYSTLTLDLILTTLLIVVITVGLQTVGVILMSALLIAPAAAARQITTRISSMALCAAGIGACASTLGTTISYNVEHLPTGPTIVVIVTLIACTSLCTSIRRVPGHE